MKEITTINIFSQTCKLLRFPLAFLVIIIHTEKWNNGIPSMPISNLNHIDLLDCFRIILGEGIARLAVPTFFLMSGYYFFFSKVNSFNHVSYLQTIKKRFKTLFIPYLVWNIIALVINKKLSIFSYLVNTEILLIINETFYKPADFPLWYVRDLMLLTLLSPIIYTISKNSYTIIFMSLVYVVFPSIPYIQSIVFFSIGAYYSINEKTPLIINNSYISILLTLSIIILSTYFFTYGNIYSRNLLSIFIIITIPLLFVMFSRFSQTKFNSKYAKQLSGSSFFIFAAHSIGIQFYCNSLIDDLLPYNHPLILCLKYLASPILVCFITYVLYLIVKNNTLLSTVLCGNR